MKAVIMAGGRGTRISSVASDIPKPMIPIEGKPILERELECLRDQGFDDIILTVSHLGDVIMDYFGDGSCISPVTGKPFGVHIDYYFEKEPLGNAGALFRIKNQLTEDFLLLNADAMFDVDFNRFVSYHKEKGGLVTLFTRCHCHILRRIRCNCKHKIRQSKNSSTHYMAGRVHMSFINLHTAFGIAIVYFLYLNTGCHHCKPVCKEKLSCLL